jgi:hypothetical protein
MTSPDAPLPEPPESSAVHPVLGLALLFCGVCKDSMEYHQDSQTREFTARCSRCDVTVIPPVMQTDSLVLLKDPAA